MALPALLARAAFAHAGRAGMSSLGKAGLAGYGYAIGWSINAIAGPVSSVATREIGYRAERLATNHIADPSHLLHAWWTGELSLGLLKEYMSYNGVPLQGLGAGAPTTNEEVWRAVVRSQRPAFDTSTVVSLWQRGFIDHEAAIKRLARNGFARVADWSLILRDRGWYDVGMATDLWQQGILTDAQYTQRLERSGIGEPTARQHMLTQRGVANVAHYTAWWSSGRIDDAGMRTRLAREGITSEQEVGLYLSDYERIGLDDAIGMHRLGKMTEAQLREVAQKSGYRDSVTTQLLNIDSPLSVTNAIEYMRRSRGAEPVELSAALASGGIVDPARRNLYLDAQRPLPSLADAHRFANRGVWDQQLAARWQLDAGIPAQYQDLAVWIGADWNPRDLGTAADASNWPSLETAYWRASVTLLSVDQGIEALRRLGGGRHQRYQGLIPDLTEFTSADLSSLYSAYGFSPVHAKWHYALQTPEIPYGVVLGRYLVQPSMRAWARNTLLRLGYLAPDADDILDTVDARRDWRDNRVRRALTQRTVSMGYAATEKGYQLGTYTDAQAAESLMALGFTAGQIRATLAVWSAQHNLAQWEASARMLKREYMGGVISGPEAIQALTQLRLKPDRVQLTIAQWQLERSWTRRVASSQQILRWVSRGLLTPAVATMRLGNLGWTAPDIALQLAEAQGGLAKANAAQVAAMGRARAKAASQLEKVAKQHASAIKDAQAKLKRLTPLSAIREWLDKGLVSELWAKERLVAMGYPADVADTYIADWQTKKPAAPKAGAAGSKGAP